MKKTILFAVLIIFICNITNVKAQSPAQPYVDQAKTSIKNLEEKSASPNWASGNYDAGYNSQLKALGSNIESIKKKDPGYNIAELQSKYDNFKKKRDDGLQKVKDDKVSQKDKEAQDAKNAEAAKDAASHQKIKDDGITNPVHQKNMQKIVFSSSEIASVNPNESGFGSEFSINSPIHFRAYFKESLYNSLVSKYNSSYLEDRSSFICKIYVDGELAYYDGFLTQVNGVKIYTSDNRKTSTTISGVLDLKMDKMGSNEFFKALLAMESKLAPGKHTLKMELYPSHVSDKKESGEMMASGEFNLNVTKGFINPKDYIICMPTSKKSDPALEAKFLASAKEVWAANNLKGEIKKLVIRSTDWEISKNEYTGKILSRSMYAAVGVSDNGKCKYAVFVFSQDYDGKGYQAKLNPSLTLTEGPIFCDCLKGK